MRFRIGRREAALVETGIRPGLGGMAVGQTAWRSRGRAVVSQGAKKQDGIMKCHP